MVAFSALLLLAAALGKVTNASWAGVNSYFLHTLSTADQQEILVNLKAAHITNVRLFITAVSLGAKGTSSAGAVDIEGFSPGNWANGWNDTQLTQIDNLITLIANNNYGIKLTIAMHDRYALGVWGCDAYCYGYSLPQVLNGGSQDASAFYNNAKAQADYDARLKHIVTHKHPTYGTWGSLSSYIYAFDIQNESQGSMPASTAYGNNPNWLCTRATNLRSNVNNGVKISTGGGQAFADSMLSQNFACSAIDVVALHSYENNLLAAGFKTQMTNALALGSKNNKTVVLQEFGSTGVNAKASWLQAVGQVANFLNIPWMTWQVTKITSGTTGYSQNEFYTTDTAAWSALSSLAANTQGETVATLSENAACSASAQCFSGCCVSGKCSSSVTPFSGTCAKITAQWTQCASSWHCNDGCCTGTFSGNVWKCTDGQGVLGSICLQY